VPGSVATGSPWSPGLTRRVPIGLNFTVISGYCSAWKRLPTYPALKRRKATHSLAYTQQIEPVKNEARERIGYLQISLWHVKAGRLFWRSHSPG